MFADFEHFLPLESYALKSLWKDTPVPFFEV